jgi:hypothetical protein
MGQQSILFTTFGEYFPVLVIHTDTTHIGNHIGLIHRREHPLGDSTRILGGATGNILNFRTVRINHILVQILMLDWIGQYLIVQLDIVLVEKFLFDIGNTNIQQWIANAEEFAYTCCENEKETATTTRRKALCETQVCNTFLRAIDYSVYGPVNFVMVGGLFYGLPILWL